MLFILHEDRLKVTKSKNLYSFYFEYDRVKYFIKSNGYSYDAQTRLYKKTMLDNGRYKLELITTVSNNHVSDLSNYFMNSTGVLNQVNKVGLIKEMIRSKLVDGAWKFKEEIRKDDEEIVKLEHRISELRDEINKIRWR